MSWIRKSAYVVGVNLLVLLGLLAALAIVPPLVKDLSVGIKAAYRAVVPKEEKRRKRATLPVYDEYDWAPQHFAEFERQKTVYYDHIGWRRAEFRGETITVDADGYRRHDPATDFGSADAWFFGGSTIWGTGVTDDTTVPAHFQRATSLRSFNFGESAYTAHQSLNLLIKAYLSGGRPKYVVFYDGVNEVAHKCRREHGFYSSGQEATIRRRLETKRESQLYRALSPTIEMLRDAVGSGGATEGGYDCDTNAAKAELVAKTLVLDWSLAKRIVEDNGGVFVPVLQPVAYLGTPNVSYLTKMHKEKALGRQYQAVYPEIKRLLKEQGFAYYDFTGLFDGDDPLYIDFCHVVPKGNERVAQKLASVISGR